MGFLKRKEIEDTFASKGPYKGKPRKNIFALKIKDKKPFNLGADGDGGEVYGKKFITRKWPYILEYTLSKTSKKIYKIDASKIFKDADFGGAAVSGGNATSISIDTAQQEKISALIFEQVLNKKTKKWKSFEMMYDDPKSGLKKIHPRLKIKNYKKDNWWKHFDLQFEEIDKTTKLPSNHFEVFNRDGGFMDFISKLITKGTGGSLLSKEFSKFGQKDSWNPADIWLIDTAPNGPFKKVKEQLENALSIKAINNILRIAFNKNIIVGISLKKSRGTTGTLLYEKINLYTTVKQQKLPLVKIQYIEFDPYYERGGFPSVTSNIVFEDNEKRIYYLTFRRNRAVVGDITYEFLEKGMPAQIGKIPKDRFAQELKKWNLKYPSKSDHTKYVESHWKKSKSGAGSLLKKYNWRVGSKSKSRVKLTKPKGYTKEEWQIELDERTSKSVQTQWKDFVPNMKKSWSKGLWLGNTSMMQMCDFLYILSIILKKKGEKKFEHFMTDLFYYAQKKGQKWEFGPFGKLY